MVESHVPSEEEKAAVLEAQRQAREEAMVSQICQNLSLQLNLNTLWLPMWSSG